MRIIYIHIYISRRESIEYRDDGTPLIKAKREEPLRRGPSVWANRKRQRRIAPRSSTLVERGQFIIIRQPPTRRSISSCPNWLPGSNALDSAFREEFLPYPDRGPPISPWSSAGRPPPRAAAKALLSRGRSRTPRARACCNATGGILWRVKRKVVD